MKNLDHQSESETLLRYARVCGAMLTASAMPSLSCFLAGLLSDPHAATRWLLAAGMLAIAPATGAVAMLAAAVSRRATQTLLLLSGTVALSGAAILTFRVLTGNTEAGRTMAEVLGASCLALSWLCAFCIAGFTRRAIDHQAQPVSIATV